MEDANPLSELPDKKTFNAKLKEIISKKKRNDNLGYFSKEQYSQFIHEVKEAKVKRGSTKDFRRLHRFAVVTVQEEDRLIVPMKPGEDSMKFYVTVDEVYDVLLEAHLNTGHGGFTGWATKTGL